MPARDTRRPRPSRWTSFLADPGEEKQRILHEQGNPAHRAFLRLYRD